MRLKGPVRVDCIINLYYWKSMWCIGLGQHPITDLNAMHKIRTAQAKPYWSRCSRQTYTAHPTHDHTRAYCMGLTYSRQKPLSERTRLMCDYQLCAFVKLTRIIMSVLVRLILQPWWSDFQRRLLYEFNQNKPWKITTESKRRPIWAAFRVNAPSTCTISPHVDLVHNCVKNVWSCLMPPSYKLTKRKGGTYHVMRSRFRGKLM